MHAGCIALQILLLDAVPTIGVRSYLNFLTYYTPKMLRAVDTVIQQARQRVAAQPQAWCRTTANTDSYMHGSLSHPRAPMVAAQHHPMSVLQQPGASAAGGYWGRLHGAVDHQ